MKLLQWFIARRAGIATARQKQQYLQRAGSDECCPHCDTWASQSNGWAKVEPHPVDPSVEVFTCANCSKTSNWIYGPGLFIHLDKEPTQ